MKLSSDDYFVFFLTFFLTLSAGSYPGKKRAKKKVIEVQRIDDSIDDQLAKMKATRNVTKWSYKDKNVSELYQYINRNSGLTPGMVNSSPRDEDLKD